ncbi:MAG: class I SAM-dependent methyltransferase [Bacteroidota bacterium]
MINSTKQIQIETILNGLYKDAACDFHKVIKGALKSVFRPMKPSDFRNAYLSISREQGKYLKKLITDHNLKNIVEFGTSFGISTLFLAQGVMETGGKVITTELVRPKALKAIENFKKAGVENLIEVRQGDALATLKNHVEPIDLLVLDGWKDLYLPIFEMLEANFYPNTFIYVDNAEMGETRAFLKAVAKKSRYEMKFKHNRKAVLISRRS